MCSTIRRMMSQNLLRTLSFFFAGCFLWATGAVADVTVKGFLAARYTSVESQPSWLTGGLGRLRVGSDTTNDTSTHGLGMAHFAVEASTKHFSAYVHGVARTEPDVVSADEAGLVEGYVQFKASPRRNDRFRIRLGQFFLPTSRENVDMLWSSPYTLTFSAINSWIAEEVRPIGLGFDYDFAIGQIDQLRIGGSYFGGNDTSGTLLAWRGWSFHDRLTGYDEVMPLPTLDSLAPGGGFYKQRDDGTLPFGSDLDDEYGTAYYIRYMRPDKFVLQWTRYDNNGDRGLYHSGPQYEYVWETSFDLYALEAQLSPSLTVLGEWMTGETGMGFPGSPWVQADFDSAYLMASWTFGNFRLSTRYDTFETVDRDGYSGSRPNEDGEAITVALLWDGSDRIRVGLEAIDVSGDRPDVFEQPLSASLDATAYSFEFRYYFDF